MSLAAPARAAARASPRMRLLFGVLVLALMLALVAPMFRDLIAHDAPEPEGGRVSYRRWGALDRPVELGGTWRLDWLGGGTTPPGATAAAPVPGGWEGLPVSGGSTLPARGAAAYTLTLADLPAGRYTLYVPLTFAADRLFVDGRLVEQRGRFATTAAATRYDLRSHEIPIVATGAPVTLRIELAAFLHRDTGLSGAPVFGLAVPMRRWIALEWMRDLILHSALILLGLNALITYLFRRQDRASLLLALSSFCGIPGTAILSYDNLLLLALPGLPFRAMLALQYLATTASIGFLFGYIATLYPRETPRWLARVALGPVAAYFLACSIAFLFSTTYVASRIAVVWPIVSGIALLGASVVVLRAGRRGRPGAMILLVGFAIMTAFVLNATLGFSGIIPQRFLFGNYALPLGLLMWLFSHFIVLAERWTLAIDSAERINADLRELIEVNSAITSEMQLDQLLARIVEVTSRILDADRSTLMLYDERTDELWSLVAEGLTLREIRMQAGEGLAGHVFRTGEILNIADAYADPRFNRAVDTASAYRTRGILTMPVTARDGRRLGVMQTLNRRDGKPFSDDDVRRMIAFAAQAAIAIDNATLFAEVVASRNYNESILRSMSTGVVTLDREAEIGKLNAAASHILGVPADILEGLDARKLLADTNPWLLAEIETVLARGERKSLIDVDLVTAGDRVISTNIQIVPLIGESGPAGILLLIEDISEGKRMQGAMRRFMTQKVVDQVLERGDELMFGTACNASILFADIRNFTTMAEALTPRETVDMLNEAFTEFVEAVAANDGVLDKFIGDAIMAVYGAPLPTGRDPENAVESAVQMLRALRLLNEARADRTLPTLRLGVGIASGEVVAGTIGSPKRMDYTVIGDSVNLSSRLQDLTKGYGVEILVCEATAAAIGTRFPLRELDLILVRGRQRPAKIFQVMLEDVPGLRDHYARGRERMAGRDWAGAAQAFRAALLRVPGDRPSELMLARAEAYVAAPPAADWNGVWPAAPK